MHTFTTLALLISPLLAHPTSNALEEIKKHSPSDSSASKTATATPPVHTKSTLPPGMCHMHVDEYEIACLDDKKNLHANITIWDAKGAVIGSSSKSGQDDKLLPGINADDPFRMKSHLPADLVVTGEHKDDYIRFTLETTPQLSWTSHTSKRDSPHAYCHNGGWNPRAGSKCDHHDTGSKNAKNQIDCWFKC